MKNTRRLISVASACIGTVCLVAAVILVIRQIRDDKNSQNTINQLRDSAEAQAEGSVSPEPSPVPTDTPDPSPETTASPTPTPEPTPVLVENPYQDSFLANSDMAGWLQIPDTVIDYPVMWTPEDEIYYLYRGFDGSSNQNGCLILDTDSCLNPLTTNLIIHGHNMKSGAMFGTLFDYENEEFYQTHREIILYTEECRRNYEVIAVFFSQVFKKSQTDVFKFYKFFQAESQEEFDDFYNNIMEMSLYDTGVTAQFGDNFLTLSTCSYHVEEGRFVVVAKEVENGDNYLPLAREDDGRRSESTERH